MVTQVLPPGKELARLGAASVAIREFSVPPPLIRDELIAQMHADAEREIPALLFDVLPISAPI